MRRSLEEERWSRTQGTFNLVCCPKAHLDHFIEESIRVGTNNEIGRRWTASALSCSQGEVLRNHLICLKRLVMNCRNFGVARTDRGALKAITT